MRRFYIFIKPFLEPGPLPFLFIIGVILFNMLSSAIYDVLRGWLKTNWMILLGIAGLIALVVIIYVFFVVLLQQRLVVTDVSPRQALIVLVSVGRLSEIPACGAIRYHFRGDYREVTNPVLKHLWLVTSPQPEEEPEARPEDENKEPYQSAWKNAQDLAGRYKNLLDSVEIVEIDPEDPQDIFDHIDQIYKTARAKKIPANEMVADITGGTKMMTTGMVLACTPADRNVQFMKPRAYTRDGRAIPSAGADPKLVDLNFTLQSARDTVTGD